MSMRILGNTLNVSLDWLICDKGTMFYKEEEERQTPAAEKEPVPEMDETAIDNTLFNDITIILKYMDNLLGDLPEEKIKEFSQSKYFSLYKEVFEKMNIA